MKTFSMMDEYGNGIEINAPGPDYLDDTVCVIRVIADNGMMINEAGFTAGDMIRVAEHLLRRARKA